MFELASPAWVDAARSYLVDGFAALPDGLRETCSLSVCESFTSPPAHLDDGHGRAGWWFVLGQGAAAAGGGYLASADRLLEAPYSEVLPLARTVYEGAVLKQARASLSAMAPEVAELLIGMHNHVAVRTL